MAKHSCRHTKTWIIDGGLGEWCWQCGAIRELRLVDGPNVLAPKSGWAYPDITGKKNPYEKMAKSRERYLKAREGR